jgi:TolB protein
MRRIVWLAIATVGAWLVVMAQDVTIKLQQGERPAMAIPDFRGAGDAQSFMDAFNQTLWADVNGAGLFKMVPKTMYPSAVPQQPSDFRQPPSVVERTPVRGRQQLSQPQTGGGWWMSDWSGAPASANYLAFGYTAVQNGVFVLRGWLFDLSRGVPASAQVVGNTYLGTVDEAGARKVAHEFAADIIARFGGKTLFDTHVYFVSNRTGHKEVWVMDQDGKNQRQVTRFNSTSIQPTVSPDGSKIAFTSYARINPAIFIFSVDPVRDLRFYNQRASVNETPEFTPDGKQMVYASSAPNDRCCRIYIANLDGSGLRPITTSSFIDVEPKVNPKTGNEIVFVSGRSGPQQIYRMNMDGSDIERLTPGEGEASNPSWHPDGQMIAYAWTRGYAQGAFNIFIMDVASRKYTQLTHGEGRNENPTWAPDGRHLVFMSTRAGSHQIWSMLADGTQVQQLTTQGSNETPVWGK